jgi:cytidine deaminase
LVCGSTAKNCLSTGGGPGWNGPKSPFLLRLTGTNFSKVLHKIPVFSNQGVEMITTAQRARLLEAAREVLKMAYAPYSRFRVGAALLTAKGAIFSGANVENASYGLSLCAERAAVAAAVAAAGPVLKIRALAVVCDRPGACPPCGACRQVISEFSEEAVLIFPGPDGLVEMPLEALLPHGFRLGPEKG